MTELNIILIIFHHDPEFIKRTNFLMVRKDQLIGLESL